eukprot:3772648-Pleurochrysis_carterae.AAC.7
MTEPPGELMYRYIGLLESSESENSMTAIICNETGQFAQDLGMHTKAMVSKHIHPADVNGKGVSTWLQTSSSISCPRKIMRS